MHRLDHVRFDIAAVTNITHEHLDFHGTVENYQRAKATLLERVAAESGCRSRSTLTMLAREQSSTSPRARRSFGTAQLGSMPTCAHATFGRREAGSTFVLDAGTYGSAECTLPLIGEFNVANALCAAGIALAAGVDFDAIAAALATAPPVPGRMARVEAGQPFSVVVDYAHTPDAIEKVLTLLRRLHPSGRVIAVFGSAGERDVEKRPLQGAIAARLADVSVITSEDPRFEDADAIIAQIAAGAEAEGAVAGKSLFCRTDRRDAIRLALRFSSARETACCWRARVTRGASSGAERNCRGTKPRWLVSSCATGDSASPEIAEELRLVAARFPQSDRPSGR